MNARVSEGGMMDNQKILAMCEKLSDRECFLRAMRLALRAKRTGTLSEYDTAVLEALLRHAWWEPGFDTFQLECSAINVVDEELSNP